MNELKTKIADYIIECGYTWKVEDIFSEYEKYRSGYYVSHTCKDVIKKFENEFKQLPIKIELADYIVVLKNKNYELISINNKRLR